ncbi:hypothetical protein D3C75_1146200 [compost metagenome]
MHANVALLIHFGKTQVTDIQPTAVVEIELRGHIQHGAGVDVRTEGHALRGNAADGAGLDRQYEIIGTPLFASDQADAVGNAHPNVAHRSFTHLK